MIHVNDAYTVIQKEHLYKVFKKMQKKNRQQLELIRKKIEQIKADPYAFKLLRTAAPAAR